jgi:hypothetical protein
MPAKPIAATSLFLLVLGSGLPAPLAAQTDPVIAETRQRLSADLERMVRAKLPLSANEARAFWPLFREYRQDTAWVGERAAELFEDFVEAYPAMTDEQAASLLKDWLSVQQAYLDTKHGWVDRFLERLPAKTVARFFQLENQFETLVRSEIAKGVPLIKVRAPNDFLDPPRNPLDPPSEP